MSGFSITVTTRTVSKAVRLLANEPVRLLPNLRAANHRPADWHHATVEITGYERGDQQAALRCWILDADGMPTERILVPIGDVASIEITEED